MAEIQLIDRIITAEEEKNLSSTYELDLDAFFDVYQDAIIELVTFCGKHGLTVEDTIRRFEYFIDGDTENAFREA